MLHVAVSSHHILHQAAIILVSRLSWDPGPKGLYGPSFHTSSGGGGSWLLSGHSGEGSGRAPAARGRPHSTVVQTPSCGSIKPTALLHQHFQERFFSGNPSGLHFHCTSNYCESGSLGSGEIRPAEAMVVRLFKPCVSACCVFSSTRLWAALPETGFTSLTDHPPQQRCSKRCLADTCSRFCCRSHHNHASESCFFCLQRPEELFIAESVIPPHPQLCCENTPFSAAAAFQISLSCEPCVHVHVS